MRSRPNLAVEVGALNDLSRNELIGLWRKIYRMEPPTGVRCELMIKAIAWHLQAKLLGGLSAETRRLLRSAIAKVESEMLARDRASVDAVDRQSRKLILGTDVLGQTAVPKPGSPPLKRRRLTPGARLMREWNGRTHMVDVIEGGFVFEAKVYSSLTAIAGKITGAHWSGPRFFGL